MQARPCFAAARACIGRYLLSSKMNSIKILEEFRQFLIGSWNSLPNRIKNNDNYQLDDWLQANWEILVEARLFYDQNKINKLILEVYGNGADFNGASSRVFAPEAKATHYICINQNYKFEAFGKQYENGWFGMELPFDKVLVTDENDNEIILDVSDINCELKEVLTSR
ncbi:hypothetical protein [Catalinimonas niigatensis]|uniref:hypothetical protein n=1 Tax=Catalinimonas niigatensis TaxID=1397264 RepID=UPI002665E37C|nr:hypothetical protein [Catalinimonas niigatensis]WPP50689.1 hypothetical protein PZB72_28920 [Catalinimonas niigatensis]